MPESTVSSPPTSPTDALLVDATCPAGVPLTANYKLGFAYLTLNQRLPVIVTKIIDQLSRDKNELTEQQGEKAREDVKTIVGALAKMKNEMITNKPLCKLDCPVWDGYLEKMASLYFQGNLDEVKWYFTPWLHWECYFYARIQLAFQLSEHFKKFDYFRKQKEDGFISAEKSAALLGEYVLNAESTDTVLQALLQVGLWGNRCDLSLSVGENVSEMGNLVDQLQDLQKFVLCDDSANFWKILKDAKESPSGNPVTIGYVLDNAGFELFTDFCLADKLMDRVDRVDFYVKTTPWFISDTMVHDFHWLIEKMSKSTEFPFLVKLAERWKGYVDSNRWVVVESPFWTYPHAYFEMKTVDPALYTMLSKHTHLIFKGDLNYRKLIGDWNWPPSTPFLEALRGFTPAPLLSLRTLKADCIAGLKPGVAEDAQKKSPDWLITGQYGILQHAQ